MKPKTLAAAVLGIAALAAALPAPSDAGVYRAIQCAPSRNVGTGAWAFHANSAAFDRVARCGAGGPGLGITHAHRRTPAGRSGTWAAVPPPGVHLIGGAIAARGAGHNSYVPRLGYRLLDGRNVMLDRHLPHGDFKRYFWDPAAPATSLYATLVCARSSGRCGRSTKPRIYVKGARFRLQDVARPTIGGLGGTILSGAAQRGTQTLGLRASDVGSGIKRLLLSVNGAFVDSDSADCATRDGIALNFSPCPATAGLGTSLNTAAAPFHDGENTIRACVTDYAASAPNERCATRRVRVDNDCPISPVTSGTQVDLHFTPGRRTHRKVPYGRRPAVSGELLDAAGRPVGGATVCISQRPPLANSVERTLAVTRTSPAGRVHVPLPRGTSRTVYLTYWRNAELVVTTAVRLRVRAPVRLKIKPHHMLHNGARPRYIARIRGPYHRDREVQFEAKAPGGRWFGLPGGHGTATTSRRGIARTRMPRLRASTNYKLRFRAVVPKQQGYPYTRGTSKVRKRLVRRGHG
jgi:hypothetical protein